MNEPREPWDEQLRAALEEQAGSIEAVTAWAPPTQHPRTSRHPWRWLTPLAAAAAVLLIVIGVAATRLGADRHVRPASPAPTGPTGVVSTIAPSSTASTATVSPSIARTASTATVPPSSISSSGPTTTSGPAATAPPTQASTAPAAPTDVFAEVTGGGSGAVVLVSAVTGAVVRTLVPAAGVGGGATAPGGRDFAVVGPSGRYVYYTDVAGAARVPVAGGPVQQLADLARRDGGGDVSNVFADRSDSRFEETIAYADDSKPSAVYVATLGSVAVTYLGSDREAVGWNPTGTTAYVATAYGINSVTGIPLAAPRTHDFQQTLSCAVTAAIGPTGQLGWATLRGNCRSSTPRRVTYAINSDGHQARFTAPGPTNKPPYYDYTLEYTPAGTAVLVGYGYPCRGTNPVWVVRAGSSRAVEFSGADPQCR